MTTKPTGPDYGHQAVSDKIIPFNAHIAACECCGNVAELRPYGANGEHICYACGQKNPEQTERAAMEHLNDET